MQGLVARTMIMLAALSVVRPTRAGGLACVECCKAAGLVSCPTKLRVFGDGSIAALEPGGWRVIGVWWLDCEAGASFQSGGTLLVPEQPLSGEILMSGYPPKMMPCFDKACALPAGACIEQREGGRYVLSHCTDRQPLTEAEMRTSRR